MNRVWNRRRRWTRMERAIRDGMKVVGRDPEATVLLPEDLVLISWQRYRLLRVTEALLGEEAEART